MTVFQWIAVPIAALLFLRSTMRFLRGEGHRWVSALAAWLWLAAAVTIAQPDLTNRVARFFGIGRGADLVSYLVALSFLMSVVYFYHKYRKLNSDVTEIVRSLAIRDALREPPEPSGNAGGGGGPADREPTATP